MSNPLHSLEMRRAEKDAILSSQDSDIDLPPSSSTSWTWGPWANLKKSQQFMIKAGIIVGSGGFIFGYDIGVISGALGQLDDRFHLSSIESGLIVAFLPLGSIFGCFIGGPLCDYIGRWKTIQLQNLIFILGSLTIASASSVDTIYVGRFIVGIASAFSAVADIPYLNEISPPEYRGRLSSAYELLVVLGIFLSFVVDLLLSGMEGGWRLMFGLPSLFAALQSIGMLSLPESPKWLIQNNHTEEARAALSAALDSSSDVAAHISDIERHSIHTDEVLRSSFRAVLYEYRYPMIAILVLMFFQQFTGGVVVRNYAALIFEDAGFGSKAALTFTVILGAVKVVITAWAILYVDSLGRKPLLLWGVILIAAGMLILTIGFAVGVAAGAEVGIFLTACSLITAGYSIGFGPVCWLLQGEMFPTLIRSRAMAASVIASNLAQFIVNFAFLPLVDAIHDAGTFFFFLVMCAFAVVFIQVCMVETKEKEPEDILKSFHHLRYNDYTFCWPCSNASESSSSRSGSNALNHYASSSRYGTTTEHD